MKAKLIAILILASCGTKQDFENDKTVPKVLKEYHENQSK
jgi:hypothetical protein